MAPGTWHGRLSVVRAGTRTDGLTVMDSHGVNALIAAFHATQTAGGGCVRRAYGAPCCAPCRS